MDSSKITYVPGWLDKAEFNGFENGVDIWTKPLDYSMKVDGDCIIGHSLGANFALANWKQNKNAKLVLVNPLLPKRSVLKWALRWWCFFVTEGIFNANPKRIAMFFSFRRGILNAYNVLSCDLEILIDEIPKDRIVVVVGEKDRFFMDKKSKAYLQEKGIKVVSVPNMGHVFKVNLAKDILDSI